MSGTLFVMLTFILAEVTLRIPKPLRDSTAVIVFKSSANFEDTVLPKIYDVIGCAKASKKPQLAYTIGKAGPKTAEDLDTQAHFDMLCKKVCGREALIKITLEVRTL